MSEITGLTRGGETYVPKFVMELDQASCIGCGRCYKVCPRDVFELVGREDADDDGDDFEDDDDDDNSMVMALSNPLDCIGCEACSRVCPKDCMTHAPSAVAA
ncbi:MAG: ferredoxin III, nif-specific [Pseudomonadota bacterium]